MKQLRLRSRSDLPRVMQKVAEPGFKFRVTGTGTKPTQSSGQGAFPGGPNASPFRDHVPLHLLSPPRTPSVISVPFSLILAVIVSISVHPDLDLKPFCAGGEHQHNVAGSGFICPGGSNPGPATHVQLGKLVSSFPWDSVASVK